MKRRSFFAMLAGAFAAPAIAKEVVETPGGLATGGSLKTFSYIAPDYNPGNPSKVMHFVTTSHEWRNALPLSELVNNPEHVKKINDFITGTSIDAITAGTFVGEGGTSGVRIEAKSTNINTELKIFNDGTMELTKSELGKTPRFNRFRTQRAMDYITSLGYGFAQ